MSNKPLLTFLLSNFLTFLLPSQTCECPQLAPVTKDECNKYDVIFKGKIDSIFKCDGTSTALFTIEELYKGKCTEQTPVIFDCSSACQMGFIKGEGWIIYANYKKFRYAETEFCGHSRKFLKGASQDYYTVTHLMSFEEEADFLKTNFGTQPIVAENTEEEMLKRDLIKPKGVTPLILIGVSLVIMGLIFFLMKRFR